MERIRPLVADAAPIDIQLNDVSFETGDGTRVVDRVTCGVQAGESVLVMGPSGSGKTLLAKVMAGLLPATDGAVAFEGTVVSTMTDTELNRRRLRHAFAFQDAALWQNLTVRQNLMLPVQYHFPKTPVADIELRIEHLQHRLGFEEDLDQRPARLSTGEQKIASFMRALMLDPEVLFLDEPSSGLDGTTVSRLIPLLRELHGSGVTLIIVSHNSRIASMLAERVLVMDRARLIADGDPAELAKSADRHLQEILEDVLDLSSTYDSEILDMLGGDDESGL